MRKRSKKEMSQEKEAHAVECVEGNYKQWEAK